MLKMGQVCVEWDFVILFCVLAYNRRMKKSIVSISLAVAIFFITAVTLCVQALNGAQTVGTFAEGGMKIVIDAGHGGIDGGVTGLTTGKKESDLNLEISLVLKERLESNGFDVTLTRKTEGGLYDVATKGFKRRDMQRRKEIIEDTKPVFTLSIHQNFYPSKSVRGGQVFYNAKDYKSVRLAKALQEELNGLYAKDGAKARKEKAGEYYMLECTTYPSVIVECGFLSNAKDEALLTDGTWQGVFADSIVSAVMKYVSDYTA